MTPPPWILEYAIDLAMRELAKKASEKTATDGKPEKAATKRAEKPSKSARSDRASKDRYEQAMKNLAEQGFTDIKLPENGGAYFNQGDYKNIPFPKIWVIEKLKEHGFDPEKIYSNKDDYKNFPFSEIGVYGKEATRTLQSGGCGPTALAIAVATLRPDSRTTPRDIAKFALENGYSSPRSKPTGRGADMGMVKTVAEDHNLKSVKLKDKDRDKVDQLRAGLKDGGVAVVHVDASIFNGHFEENPKGNGHWIAVNGYAVDESTRPPTEWFFVANPGSADPLGAATKFLKKEGMAAGEEASAELLKDRGVVVDERLHHGAGRVRVSREALEDLMQEAYVVTNRPDQPA